MARFPRPSVVLRRNLCLIGVVLFGALVPPAAVSAAGAGAGDTTTAVCRDLDVPVTLGSLPAYVHGRLCHPPSGPSGTVQLLLHGGTYNHTYWDFPYQAQHYSYVRAAARQGYSTLNIDRVGYGQSSAVPSAALTGSSQANAVHQIVGALRHGAIGGIPFPKVVLVGHSLGSGVSILEAATYQDVDGVVLTGAAHPFTPHAVAHGFVGHFQPAFLDPHFAGQTLDPGYITTVPGARGVVFYSRQVDPDVLDVDEATKDKASSVEAGEIIGNAFGGPISRRIVVPTLLLNGSDDSLFCQGPAATDCSSASAMKDDEAGNFSPAACLEAQVVVGAGHNVALSLAAPESFKLMIDWVDSYIGRTGGPVRPPDPSCGRS